MVGRRQGGGGDGRAGERPPTVAGESTGGAMGCACSARAGRPCCRVVPTTSVTTGCGAASGASGDGRGVGHCLLLPDRRVAPPLQTRTRPKASASPTAARHSSGVEIPRRPWSTTAAPSALPYAAFTGSGDGRRERNTRRPRRRQTRRRGARAPPPASPADHAPLAPPRVSRPCPRPCVPCASHPTLSVLPRRQPRRRPGREGGGNARGGRWSRQGGCASGATPRPSTLPPPVPCGGSHCVGGCPPGTSSAADRVVGERGGGREREGRQAPWGGARAGGVTPTPSWEEAGG